MMHYWADNGSVTGANLCLSRRSGEWRTTRWELVRCADCLAGRTDKRVSG